MKNLIKKFLGKIDKNYNKPDARDNYLEKIELSYLYNMFNIFRDIENCPGHIIELGVGAGRNAILLGNLLKTTGQNGSSRYFGFDSFKSYTDRDLQIEKGLNGQSFVILYVKAEVQMGYGQEVYPSQELILDTGKDKSKVLYQKSAIAGMHSQKLGNAIRTIDTWYPDAEFPIAAEPYGAVTTLGTAFRQPKQKQDFYSLFDNWVLNDVAPDEGQQHYVMAVLIRGGVFGASGKE